MVLVHWQPGRAGWSLPVGHRAEPPVPPRHLQGAGVLQQFKWGRREPLSLHRLSPISVTGSSLVFTA